MQAPIYLGTILLEPNRWRGAKEPSILASEWIARARAAGMDGVELWENHYAQADASERAAVRQITQGAPLIFNSYASLDSEAAAARKAVTANILESGAEAIKFNAGGDTTRHDEYVANARDWAEQLPGVKMLCECHPGSALETPEAAARAFEVWDAARFGVMIHPFTTPPDELRRWLQLLGPQVEHAHVQIRHAGGRPARLDMQPDTARAMLQILCEGGFAGSFTLEFTEGTSSENDRPEFLWQNALADLQFLRENW